MTAQGHPLEREFNLLGDAVRVFGVAEAGTANYRLGILLGTNDRSCWGSNLNLFEREFPRMSIQQQTLLTLLIITNYDYTSACEYSERLSYMIAKNRKEIARRIKKIDKKKLRQFVVQYGQEFDGFASRCQLYLGFTP